MLQINHDLIRDRVTDINKAVRVLSGYAAVGKERFLADGTLVSAAKYELIVAIEAAQAVCNHLVVRLTDRAPSSYSDCFQLLGEVGVIPVTLVPRMVAMAKFRNLLVHKYGKIDDTRVYSILSRDLGDFEAFIEALGRYLENEE